MRKQHRHVLAASFFDTSTIFQASMMSLRSIVYSLRINYRKFPVVYDSAIVLGCAAFSQSLLILHRGKSPLVDRMKLSCQFSFKTQMCQIWRWLIDIMFLGSVQKKMQTGLLYVTSHLCHCQLVILKPQQGGKKQPGTAFIYEEQASTLCTHTHMHTCKGKLINVTI